jgi:hypothetical protein
MFFQAWTLKDSQSIRQRSHIPRYLGSVNYVNKKGYGCKWTGETIQVITLRHKIK